MLTKRDKTILLVEDELVIARLEQQQLQRYGYEVLIVHSGEAAIELMDAESRVDLILMDIDLGSDLDGTEAAEQILANHQVPIVFLSGHTEPEIVEKTEKITSYGYVVKSSDIAVLDASIQMAFKLFEANERYRAELNERRKAEQVIRRGQARLEAINEIGLLATSSLDLETVLLRILEGVLKVVGASVGMVFLKNLETGQLCWGASIGLSETMVAEYENKLIEPGEGLTGSISENGETIFIQQDSSHDPRIARMIVANEQLNSFIGVPLYANDVIIGVMNVVTRPPAVLHEPDVLFVRAVGIHVGSTIRNARLYADVQEAQAALMESERFYRLLIDSTNEGFWHISSEYKTLHVNDALCQMLGYSSEELLGKTPMDIVDAENRKIFEAQTSKMTTTRHRNYEIVLQRKNGEKVFAHFTATTLPDNKGAFAFVTDITALKEAEDRQRASEERYQVFISQSFEGIYRTEFDTPIDTRLPVEEQIDLIYAHAYMAECNLALARMYGLSSVDDFIGARLIDAHGGKDDPVNRATFRRLIENGYKSVNDETVEVDAQGNTIWFLNNTIGIVEDGFLVRLWGTAIDMTEKKRAEAALRMSEEKYRSLFYQSHMGIYLHDFEGKILDVNPSACKQTGYSKEELLQLTVFDLHADRPGTPNLPRAQILDLWRQWQPEDRFTYQGEHQRKDGTIFPIEVSTGIVQYTEQSFILAIVSDITDRKRAETELRESRTRLQTVLDTMLGGAQIVDNDFRYVYVNDEVLTHAEVEHKADLIGHTIMEKFPGIESSELFIRLKHCLEKQVSHRFENHFLYPDGSSRWFDLAIHPIPEGLFILSYDITDRKQAEEALERSQQFLQNILNTIPDPVFVKDENHRWIMLNDAYCAASGYRREDLLDKSDYDFFPKEEAEMFWKKDDIAFASTKPIVNEETFTDAHGELHTILTRKAVFTREDGNKVLVGIATDITERKQMEEALRESEQKLIFAQYIAKLGDFSWDIKTGVVTWSEGLYNLLGYDLSEEIDYAKVNQDIHHPDDLERVTKWLNDSIASDSTKLSPNEYRLIRKDGEVIYVHTSGIIERQDGQAVRIFATLQDITQRKLSEAALQRSEQALKEANAAKDKLFSVIGHDLGNAYVAILNGTEMLCEMNLPPEAIQDVSNELYKAAANQKKLLDNLLKWAKVQTGEISPMPQIEPLGSMVNGTLSLLQDTAAHKEIRLISTIDEQITVHVDFDMISTTLRNLINNAIKFTHRGGQVTVYAREVGDFIEIAIADTGVGMTAQKIGRLFKVGEKDISSRGTDEEKGTGLGLILCKEFVDKHGGKIWVESEVDQGSTFFFTVPKAV